MILTEAFDLHVIRFITDKLHQDIPIAVVAPSGFTHHLIKVTFYSKNRIQLQAIEV